MKFDFTAIVLIAVVVAIATTTAMGQQCISPRGFNPDICLFTPSLSFTNDDTASAGLKCATTNDNPFNANPPSLNAVNSRPGCNEAIQAQGAACVNAYAKYQCDRLCDICGQSPCKSDCDSVIANCPTANDLGCFEVIHCTSGNTGCVNWQIDASKIPAYTSTASTTTSTTSTTTKAATTTTTPSTSTTGAGTTTSGTGTGTTTTTTATTSETDTTSSGNTINGPSMVHVFGIMVVVQIGISILF